MNADSYKYNSNSRPKQGSKPYTLPELIQKARQLAASDPARAHRHQRILAALLRVQRSRGALSR